MTADAETVPGDPERELARLGLTLPDPPPRAGLYEHAVYSAGHLYLSGKGPRRPDGTRPAGKVGADVSLAEAREHARITGLNLLATLKQELGAFDRVARIVKLLGLVNATPGFARHAEVIDGCSQLFIDVFGARGRHARSAFGVSSLPGNMTVEIEMIVEIRAEGEVGDPKSIVQ